MRLMRPQGNLVVRVGRPPGVSEPPHSRFVRAGKISHSQPMPIPDFIQSLRSKIGTELLQVSTVAVFASDD
jgi:hypothetical protein